MSLMEGEALKTKGGTMKTLLTNDSRESPEAEEEGLVRLGPDVFLTGNLAVTHGPEHKEAEARIHELEQQVRALREELELEREYRQVCFEVVP
jgi:hypothetical protein